MRSWRFGFALAALLIGFPFIAARAQSVVNPNSEPFSEAELYQAFRFLMPDSLARAAARGGGGAEDPPIAAHEEAHRVAGTNFFGDLLALLSLTSDSTGVKVERYRDEQRRLLGGPLPDDETWHARRAELKALIDAGLLKPRND